ncbi:MAG: RuBisCO large subunit C-terminal-like domain-containing protein [Candidatus Nanoarchaeia archaeon]|nr:RuBisCO large subunit C-terminal-like domain-containing protein [Candidatus Nanoarchaeia archaeon]MDD5741444.1 RuBisCO large subunit C-terminal-like domain-containing protein [Candidatus Nanoarchaeia archaeon]
MIDSYLFKKDVNPEENIIATYFVKSKNLEKAIRGIAIGQSVGNPDIRTQRDSHYILENHLAKIIKTDYQNGNSVKIAYPLANFGEGDGITQLLCTLMGGQMDIDIIEGCKLIDVTFPDSYLKQYKGPKFGIENIQKRTGAIGRPILGGIVKPKTGITISELEGLVKELLDGGVDFIKEDEILGNPKCCPFYERVPKIAKLVKEYSQKQGREIFYAACINSDYPEFLKRAEYASKHGINAVHLNFHSGLSSYKSLRDLDLNSAIFFQKSGDKILTGKNNPYHISWNVVCKLARMSGADFIHAGMWGGYLSDSKSDLTKVLDILKKEGRYAGTIASLSCGSNPGLVDTTIKNFGIDLMMNVGGAIQGHPMGAKAGAIAMRQAMNKPPYEDMYDYMKDKPELKAAIEKWGYVRE